MDECPLCFEGTYSLRPRSGRNGRIRINTGCCKQWMCSKCAERWNAYIARGCPFCRSTEGRVFILHTHKVGHLQGSLVHVYTDGKWFCRYIKCMKMKDERFCDYLLRLQVHFFTDTSPGLSFFHVFGHAKRAFRCHDPACAAAAEALPSLGVA